MRDPKKQISLVAFLVLLVYSWLARPVEVIKDVEISGTYAFLTVERAGLRLVDISAPEAPREVGFYDTRGAANAIAVSGSLAFVADGREGLRVIDVSDPAAPREVGAYNTAGSAEDVALF